MTAATRSARGIRILAIRFIAVHPDTLFTGRNVFGCRQGREGQTGSPSAGYRRAVRGRIENCLERSARSPAGCPRFGKQPKGSSEGPVERSK